MRKENEKELLFLKELSERFSMIIKIIGHLPDLPTTDKSSIVKSIAELHAEVLRGPQIDPDVITNRFNSRLN